MGRKCNLAILIIANVIFLATGGFVLYAGLYLKADHWTDMFEGDAMGNAQLLNDKVALAVLIIASTIIAASIAGIVGAIFRIRALLIVYAFFCTLSAIAFLIISVAGWFILGKTNNWKNKEFPADEKQEVALATRFNQVYCYATGANICNNLAFRKAIETFSPDTSDDVITMVLDALKDVLVSAGIHGMQSLCENFRANGPVADLLQLVPSFDLGPICTGCEMANQFSKFNSVFAWANEECPPDPASLKWCVHFLAKKKPGDPFKGAPFRICRSKLYDALTKWTPIVAAPALVIALALFSLVFVACVAHRRKTKTNEGDITKLEAPTTKSSGQFVPIDSKKVSLQKLKTPAA